MRHSMMSTRKSRLAAGGASAAILAIVGTGAFAYYSQSSFATNAKASTAPTMTITSVDAPQDLVPGGPQKLIQVHLKNETNDPQNVGQVIAVIPNSWNVANRNGGLTACSGNDFEIEQAPAAGALGAGDVYTVTPKIKMINRPYDQENCKGENIPLVISFQ